MRTNKSNKIPLFSLGLILLVIGCENQKETSNVDQKPSTSSSPSPSVQEEQKFEKENLEEENLEAQCFQGSQEACDQLGH